MHCPKYTLPNMKIHYLKHLLKGKLNIKTNVKWKVTFVN